uniref:Uncharacterized protein n=1 Tax=Plectus sambesii TaxID=2011161 RepID=A0A914XP90_9BILA
MRAHPGSNYRRRYAVRHRLPAVLPDRREEVLVAGILRVSSRSLIAGPDGIRSPSWRGRYSDWQYQRLTVRRGAATTRLGGRGICGRIYGPIAGVVASGGGRQPVAAAALTGSLSAPSLSSPSPLPLLSSGRG